MRRSTLSCWCERLSRTCSQRASMASCQSGNTRYPPLVPSHSMQSLSTQFHTASSGFKPASELTNFQFYLNWRFCSSLIPDISHTCASPLRGVQGALSLCQQTCLVDTFFCAQKVDLLLAKWNTAWHKLIAAEQKYKKSGLTKRPEGRPLCCGCKGRKTPYNCISRGSFVHCTFSDAGC